MRTSNLGRLALACVLLAAVPAAAQRPNQGEDESAALVAEGRDALRNNRLDDAAKALDQALALNPRRVEAYVLRSAVYAARKQYRQGIELMRRAQALAPTDEEVLTALGSQLVLSGDTAGGIPLLLEVTKANPRRYDAQLLLGHHWHTSGRWPEAITSFEAYFTSRPAALAREDGRHRIDLADSYLRARQPAKALALFEQARRERGSREPGAALKGDELRARVGIAWATAAIDCRKARPLLKDLEAIAESYPDVWLVDGQCALALGDTNAGLALGRRYLDKAEQSSAAGHALVGEAQAARGNLVEAKRSLETARKLEPTRRRWTVRLAAVLRRAGDPRAAIAALETLGPPEKAALDRDWWVELGEALLQKGEAKTAVTRLGPVAVELTTDERIRVVLGAAQLAAGDAALAIETLGEAERIASTPRSKRLLVEALVAVSIEKLRANDAAGAEPLLVRAEGLEGNALVWKHLGIARLALDHPKDAVAPLERAARAEPAPTTLMLLARAHATSGNVTAARPLYERAFAGERDKERSVEIALDWAATEIGAGGELAPVIAALERTSVTAKATPLAARHKTALATARHALGVQLLRVGQGGKAAEQLRGAIALEASLPRKCDLAIATVVAGDVNAALASLRAISKQACPFPPPADTQAAPILIAFTEGLNRQKAAKAVDRLTKLSGRSSGVAAVLLNTSIRVVALEAAQDAYRAGQLAQVRKYLATAKSAVTRVGADEVAHNLAVMDLLDGRVDIAIGNLEKIAPRVPEAYINLGIAYEKKGDPQRALDAWRKARRASVRFPQLTEWIEAKERIYGESP